jgi:hypothetical protein
MTERPILFSAPMVRALLAGRKTQTRRVLKQATGPSLSVGIEDEPGVAELSWLHGDGPGHEVHETVKKVPCPYGVPGNLLWVREAIRLVPDQEPDDGTGRVLSVYNADGSLTPADAWPWKRSYLPPMHCPRGLSRITLEVTGVRVERLQDISASDALQEGLEECHDLPYRWDHPVCFETAQRLYSELWDQINGAGTWAANPWVWVVEFRRVRPMASAKQLAGGADRQNHEPDQLVPELAPHLRAELRDHELRRVDGDLHIRQCLSGAPSLEHDVRGSERLQEDSEMVERHRPECSDGRTP